jgi:hypothetical protein
VSIRGSAPRGRAPVDRAHVVAAHVLPQAVELGALPAHHDARAAVQLAQPRQPRRQVLAGGERGEHPHRTGHPDARLPRREPQRPVGAHRDLCRPSLAPAHRSQGRAQASPFPGRQPQRLPGRTRTGRGLPRIPQHAAHRAAAGVGDEQLGLDRLAQPGARGGGAFEAKGAGRSRDGQIDGGEDRHDRQPAEQPRHPVEEHDGNAAHAEQRDEPAGDSHERSATRSAPAPAAGSTAAPCRRRRPRARPPAEAGCGAAAPGAPSPECGPASPPSIR